MCKILITVPFGYYTFHPQKGMDIDKRNKGSDMNFLKGQYIQNALTEKTKYPDNLEMSEIERFGRVQKPVDKEDIEP